MDFTKELSEKEYQELGRKHVASFKEFFDNDVQGIIQELLDTIGCSDKNDIGKTTGLFQVMHYMLLETELPRMITEELVVTKSAACCFSLLAVQTILDKLCKEKREGKKPLRSGKSRPIKGGFVPKESYDENIIDDIKYDTSDSPKSGKPYKFKYDTKDHSLYCYGNTLKVIVAGELAKGVDMKNLGTIKLFMNCDCVVPDEGQSSPIQVNIYAFGGCKAMPLKKLIEYIDDHCEHVYLI